MLPTLTNAANGHLMLCLESRSRAFLRDLARRLINDHGFRREGRRIVGFDETLFPDFRRSDCVLEAGYDIWSGYYLLSSSDPADAFLRRLHGELAADRE